MIFTKTWALGALERALKTFAQAILSVMTVGIAIWEMNWAQAAGIALTAAAYSFLTSIADPDRASLAPPGVTDNA